MLRAHAMLNETIRQHRLAGNHGHGCRRREPTTTSGRSLSSRPSYSFRDLPTRFRKTIRSLTVSFPACLFPTRSNTIHRESIKNHRARYAAGRAGTGRCCHSPTCELDVNNQQRPMASESTCSQGLADVGSTYAGLPRAVATDLCSPLADGTQEPKRAAEALLQPAVACQCLPGELIACCSRADRYIRGLRRRTGFRSQEGRDQGDQGHARHIESHRPGCAVIDT